MREGYKKQLENKNSNKKALLVILIICGIVITLGTIYLIYFNSSIKNNNATNSNSANGEIPVESSSVSNKEDNIDSIKKQIQNMTLDEKIGQIMFISFRKDANDNNIITIGESEKKVLEDIKPGGIVLFGPNILNVEQIRKYISDANQISNIPLFVSLDQEGGTVQRISNTEGIGATKIPSMFKLGNMNDISLTLSVGRVIGSELGVFGFNMDFAPDTDIFSNEKNKIIGERAFGKNADIVSKMAKALATGLMDENIIPVYKHFPRTW